MAVTDPQSSTGSDNDQDDRHVHPMAALANALGGVEYPIPISDNWIRVAFTLLPCTLLVVASIIWPRGAAFMLTFAGAFASIQLVGPYQQVSQHVADFLAEARSYHQSAIEHAKTKIRFQHQTVMYVGMQPVGYSRAGEARAKRRFAPLARRWRRRFWDLSGRVIDPISGVTPPSALPRFLYPRRAGFEYMAFVRGGRCPFTRIIRALYGTLPWSAARVVARVDESKLVHRWKKFRTERLLAKVAIELIRATRSSGADAPVRELAIIWDLRYEPPVPKPGWVVSESVNS